MTHLQTDFKASFRRRVLVSNELFADARPESVGIDASLVGIGTTTLWHMAALVRPVQVLAIDRSRSVYIQNRLLVALFRLCDDAAELRARLLSKNEAVGVYDRALYEDTLALLGLADDAAAREILWRHAFFGEALTYSGPTLGDLMRDPSHPFRDDAGFATLKTLAARGAISLQHKDVRDPVLLNEASAPCAWFYFSNVAEYVLPDKSLGDLWARLPRTNDAQAWIAVPGRGGFNLAALPLALFCERCALPASSLLTGGAPPATKPASDLLWQAFDGSDAFPAELQKDLFLEALADARSGLDATRLARARTLGLTDAEWLRSAVAIAETQPEVARALAPADRSVGSTKEWLALAPVLTDRAAIVARAMAEDLLVERAIPLCDDVSTLRALVEHGRFATDAMRRLLAIGGVDAAWLAKVSAPIRFLPGDDPSRWPVAALERLLATGADASDGMWPEPVVAALRQHQRALAAVSHFVARLGDERSPIDRARALLDYSASDAAHAIADADELALRLGLYD